MAVADSSTTLQSSGRVVLPSPLAAQGVTSPAKVLPYSGITVLPIEHTDRRSIDIRTRRCSRKTLVEKAEWRPWVVEHHDAAIHQATVASGGEVPSLYRLPVTRILPCFCCSRCSTWKISLPRFTNPAVEKAYTAYACNETNVGALTAEILGTLMGLWFLAQEFQYPSQLWLTQRLVLRSLAVITILFPMLGLIYRALLGARTLMWIRTICFILTSIAVQLRVYYEPNFGVYVRAAAIWSFALKAIALIVDVGFIRLTLFGLVDSVGSTTCEVLRPSLPNSSNPYVWEGWVLSLFLTVSYVLDVRHRNGFKLKCSVHLAQQESEESERMQRFLIDNIRDMICLHEVQPKAPRPGVIIYASQASRELLGYSPEELLNRCPLDLVHSDDTQHAVRLYSFQTYVDGSGSSDTTFRLQKTELTAPIEPEDGSLSSLPNSGSSLIHGPAPQVGREKTTPEEQPKRPASTSERIKAQTGSNSIVGSKHPDGTTTRPFTPISVNPALVYGGTAHTAENGSLEMADIFMETAPRLRRYRENVDAVKKARLTTRHAALRSATEEATEQIPLATDFPKARYPEWNRVRIRFMTKDGRVITLEVSANFTSRGLLCVYRVVY